MKHRVSRLFAILLSLITVFSVLTPVAFCKFGVPDLGDLIDDPIDDFSRNDWTNDISSELGGTDTITAITEIVVESDPSTIGQAGQVGTAKKIGTIQKLHYTEDGRLAWRVTLTATFKYNGVYSTCESASTKVETFLSGWSKLSENTSKSGSSASTSVKMKFSSILLTGYAGSADLKISCDADGNLK